MYDVANGAASGALPAGVEITGRRRAGDEGNRRRQRRRPAGSAGAAADGRLRRLLAHSGKAGDGGMYCGGCSR